MSDNVALLDKYRLALINDRDSFLVLALLLRNRSASSSDLAQELGASKARLAVVLRELYRAGWIRTAPSERYFLNDESEALMDILGMLDAGLDSLTRELLPEEKDRSWLWDRVRLATSFNQKSRCLHSLQIARWTAQSLTATDSGLWSRVLRVVLSELGTSRARLHEEASANLREPELGRADEGDVRNLWVFWDRCELPVEPRAREVTIQGSFVLMVYWYCFGSGKDPYHRLFRNDARCVRNIWSEFETREEDLSGLFARVVTYCTADYSPPRGKWTADELLSEVRRRLDTKANEQPSAEIDDCESKILRLLTSSKEP